MPRRASIAAIVLVAVSSAVATQEPTSAAWPLKVTRVESPAGADSAQPQLTVSTRGVLLSWIERAGPTATLKFAERTSSGWSEPVKVASGDDWFVNWADVPSVIRLDDGTLVAHWLQRSGSERYAYDVRLAHSGDDGRTWAFDTAGRLTVDEALTVLGELGGDLSGIPAPPAA